MCVCVCVCVCVYKVKILGRFLINRDNNIRYVGLYYICI